MAEIIVSYHVIHGANATSKQSHPTDQSAFKAAVGLLESCELRTGMTPLAVGRALLGVDRIALLVYECVTTLEPCHGEKVQYIDA